MFSLAKKCLLWGIIGGALACQGPQSSSDKQVSEANELSSKASRQGQKAKATSPKVSDQAHAASIPSADRVVAIGDVHGDISAMERALTLAQLVDETGHWIGGKATLVQTGDLLDRGDDERRILAWVKQLEGEAQIAGGKVVALNGNHEVMNVAMDLRYVTPGGYEDFADLAPKEATETMGLLQPSQWGRAVAFQPGGPYALELAQRDVTAIVGDTAFAHGGILPETVKYGLDRLNTETRRWMASGGPMPSLLSEKFGPVWSRDFSAPQVVDCKLLQQSLKMMGVSRMVVGHTVQPEGITSACDGQIWRIDVGMAKHYGGKAAALEIVGQSLRTIEAR